MWASKGGVDVREGGRWGGINRFICLRPSLIILPLPFVPDLMKPKCQVRRGPHIEPCQSRPSAHLKPRRRIIGFNIRAAFSARHDASDDSTAEVFCVFFLKRNFIWQLMRGRLHRGGFGGWMGRRLDVCTGGRVAYPGRGGLRGRRTVWRGLWWGAGGEETGP